MSLQAYQRAAARTEDPREAEYRLFGQVTRALISASQTPRSEIITRMEALDWNRRLWTALSNSCSDPQNQLPKDIRAAIVSLSLFVFRHTSAVMQNGVGFEVLIDINRMIMQGLEAANANAAKAIAS